MLVFFLFKKVGSGRKKNAKTNFINSSYIESVFVRKGIDFY